MKFFRENDELRKGIYELELLDMNYACDGYICIRNCGENTIHIISQRLILIFSTPYPVLETNGV